jgi:hypothetical protein
VIRTILQDESLSKEFKIRGITRDTSKPAAQALLKQGVELVSVSPQPPVKNLHQPSTYQHSPQADMNSKSSLLKAIQGSHSVFLVATPGWGIQGSDAELKHGKNVADVAKQTGV